MADNVTSNSGAGGGAVFATDDIGGVHYPITKITIGALDASTLLTGGSGTVDAGCPRVTLATNDAAVTALQLIDNAVSGAGFNITQFAGASVPIGAGLEATAVRVTLPTDGTGLVSAAQSGTWNGALFHEGADPLYVIKWRDVYNELEEAIDAAEDAGEIIERMIHKAA